MANIALLMNMTVLGSPTQVSYQYQKSGDNGGSFFLVAPQEVAVSSEVSISKLVENLKAIWQAFSGKTDTPAGMPDADAITGQMQSLDSSETKSEGIADQITVQLKTIYLYIDTRGGKSIFEYALCLQVKQEIIPASIKAFNIDSLSFAIWDTKNTKILDMMEIVDPSKTDNIKALKDDNGEQKADTSAS